MLVLLLASYVTQLQQIARMTVHLKCCDTHCTSYSSPGTVATGSHGEIISLPSQALPQRVIWQVSSNAGSSRKHCNRSDLCCNMQHLTPIKAAAPPRCKDWACDTQPCRCCMQLRQFVVSPVATCVPPERTTIRPDQPTNPLEVKRLHGARHTFHQSVDFS